MNLYATTIKYFHELSKIPRRSHEEKKIRNWLITWAQKHTWIYKVDTIGNLLIIAPGKNPGMICLQSHMDMVCVSSISHDWSKEGVTIVRKNEALWGDKTTLGADNGIGMSMMMAIAETTDRPTLELLFTVGEEMGLTGAHDINLPIQSNYAINLDWSNSENIGISCGGTLFIKCKYEPKIIVPKGIQIKIRISGLTGGHSGVDIHRGQGNAIIELSKIVSIRDDIHSVAYFRGGDANNAIPRSARAIVRFDGDLEELTKWILRKEKQLQKKFNNNDISITIKTSNDDYPDNYEKEIFNTITGIGSGVEKSDKNGQPLSSWNLGEIKFKNGKMKWGYFLRTNISEGIQPMKSKIIHSLEAHMNKKKNPINYKFDHESPVWSQVPNSEFIEKIAKIINKKSKTHIPCITTHATVEVGLLKEKYPGTEWVSIGATCHHMHTIDEHIYLGDIEEFCQRMEGIITAM